MNPSPKNAEDVAHLAARIQQEFGFTVQLAGEIEFSFVTDSSLDDAFWQELIALAHKEGVALESIGREQTGQKHLQQYECRFSHAEPLKAASDLDWLNVHIFNLSKKYNYQIFDYATLNESSVFNGLHLHLHLLNDEGNYCFFKQEERLSDPLSWTIGGLLEVMCALMPYFAPNEASYQRLSSGADHIPTTLSWGGNNRSCALRLPESVVPHRHIEHRVCGADAEPFAAVWALLIGVHYGLAHKPAPDPQFFGDANCADAGLARLPLSHEAALSALRDAEWLAEYW